MQCEPEPGRKTGSVSTPTAITLLKGAAAIRAEREAEQAQRTQEFMESWDYIHVARLEKSGRPGR